eukprot:gene36397-44151_t
MSLPVVTSDDLDRIAREKHLHHCFQSRSILEKCAQFSTRFPQTAEDLLGRVEAFLINQNASALTADLLGKLESSLHADYQRQVAATPEASALAKRPLAAAPSSASH